LRFTLNRRRAEAAGVERATVLASARRFIAAQPAVRRVWTAEELEAGEGPEPMATLYRNSHHPTRGGDLIVQPEAHCLFSSYPAGTSHGTPYLYDRAVPLVFSGPGVERGVVRGRAQVVDVAPTLADALGVPTPPGLNGRVLPRQTEPTQRTQR
jgi:hypothetical protein